MASQAMKLFMAKNESRRTWAKPFLYMVTDIVAQSGPASLILDNIVHHASPEMNVMRAMFDQTRVYFLRQAEDLAHFAQSIELKSGKFGRAVVAKHDKKNERKRQYVARAHGESVSGLRERNKSKKEKKNSRRKAARASGASDKGPTAFCTGDFVLAANDAISID
uniref:Transposase n=1 Tax=Peronospora matthiolae TaxID=2874970 RepID=A0AAV1THN1_9STRA